MRYLLPALSILVFSPTSPRVEVRGVEVSGVWLGLSARSYVVVFVRGPEGIRLLSPDSATTWAPLDSGAASVPFDALPSGALSPINCVVTADDIFRWEPATRSTVRLRTEDCGPLPPSTTGPGRAIPGRPTQGPGDSWYIPRPNDTADRSRYLIVVAIDGDALPPNPTSVLDDRLNAVPVLVAARALGERLGRGHPDWAAVAVPLGR